MRISIETKVNGQKNAEGLISLRPEKSGMTQTESKMPRVMSLVERADGLLSGKSWVNFGQLVILTEIPKSELFQLGLQEMMKENFMKVKKSAISTKEFDEKFEKAEDLSAHVNWDNAIKKINLDIPVWAVRALDVEASRRGVTRQSLIKNWIIDKLDSFRKTKASGA